MNKRRLAKRQRESKRWEGNEKKVVRAYILYACVALIWLDESHIAFGPQLYKARKLRNFRFSCARNPSLCLSIVCARVSLISLCTCIAAPVVDTLRIQRHLGFLFFFLSVLSPTTTVKNANDTSDLVLSRRARSRESERRINKRQL